MYVILHKNQFVAIADTELTEDVINEVSENVEVDKTELEVYVFPDTTLNEELNIAIRPKIYLERVQRIAGKDIVSELSSVNQFRFKEICGILGLSEYRIKAILENDIHFESLLSQFNQWCDLTLTTLTMVCDHTLEETIKDINLGLQGWLSQLEYRKKTQFQEEKTIEEMRDEDKLNKQAIEDTFNEIHQNVRYDEEGREIFRELPDGIIIITDYSKEGVHRVYSDGLEEWWGYDKEGNLEGYRDNISHLIQRSVN